MGGLMGKGKMRFLISAVLALVVAAGGCAWYFLRYTKTPEYSLRMIEEAVQQHDRGKFDRYVDVPRLVETSGDDFLEGLMDADHALTEEVRSAVANFAQMFKSSISMSFQSAIYDYVKTGVWGEADEQAAESEKTVDSQFILGKAGLMQTEFRAMETLERDNDRQATVSFRVYQAEADSEFVLKARLVKEDDGVWRVNEIENFRDFVAFVMKARKAKMQDYLQKTEAIVRVHDEKVAAADKKLVDILHSGSLGDMAIRRQMKTVMLEEIMPEWHSRREELSAVAPPPSAQPLHHLRLRICDLRIAYAGRYSDWLETKEASVIHEANGILKEARTLEQEAEILARQMKKTHQ
ncbi:MAG: DUF2939 domain-containing protein [Schwartzia sp.]|nr:DUF2939 domain-containing protein [Schwartzia sp. (in: firmicutes)]